MSAKTRILTLCLLITSTAGLLYGQGGASGTILGTVTDTSGAVITNAKVDVTNIATPNITHHSVVMLCSGPECGVSTD